MIDDLPNNFACEQSALSCILLDNSLMDTTLLKPEHFYSRGNREFFSQMIECYKEHKVLDWALMQQLWSDLNYFYEVSLICITPSQFQSYQDCIVENYNRRYLIQSMQKAIAQAKSDYPIETIQNSLQHISEWIVTTVIETDFLDVINDVLGWLGTNASYICRYWINAIDEVLNWYSQWQLIVIWARPWVGKTSVLLTLGHEVVKQNKKCLIFTLEMTAKEIAKRLVSKISGKWMASLSRLEWESINQVALTVVDQLDQISNFSVYDSVNDAAWIMATMRKTKFKSWVDIVFIDYLWLMEWDKAQNRNLEIQKITRDLKQLAKELWIAIVVLSQLNRNMEMANRRPQLSDLRDSWAIEQDADCVILLHRDPNDAPKEMLFMVAKNRNGKVADIELPFEPTTMTLLNSNNQ